MVKLQGVSKQFEGASDFAVRELSLEVERGQTLVLLGTSGCGKTTTLKMINRLIESTSGRIEVGGRCVTEQDAIALRRSIGYVFQGIGLLPHFTVRANVQIVPRLLGWSVAKQRERCDELLAMVGLPVGDYAERYPDALSGGQKQRVGVARALAADPDILLMDEPCSALDAITRDALQEELIDLRQRLNKTIVFVTHDVFEALRLADVIAIMHEGRLEQVDTPERIAASPASDFVKALFHKPAKQLEAFREHF